MTTTPEMTCPLAELLAAVRTPPPAVAAQPPLPAPSPPPAEGPPRLLWTTQEVSGRLAVSRSIVYGLMRNDLLPSVLLGGKRLVADVDLVTYVEQLRAAGSRWE